jgi:hypothetical protein
VGVTLQINVAPPDAPHAVHLVPHQLRTWADHVDEIVFTLDTVRPTAGRFAAGWDERAPELGALLGRLTDQYPHARIGAVDPSPAAVRAVAQGFFGREAIPMKDSRGGPLYSYMYGLHDARHDLVLHCDSDMLFGGGGRAWLAEATALLEADPDVLVVDPLPGPPREDGRLFEQPDATPVPGQAHTYRFTQMSTRVFLMDRARLRERVAPIPLAPPLLIRSRLKAMLKGNPLVAMPEQFLTTAMRQHNLTRVDQLGSEPGMWSLHPAYRSPAFYEALPEIIRRVETGDVPQAQRGHYDIVDALFDFSEQRAKNARSLLAR